MDSYLEHACKIKDEAELIEFGSLSVIEYVKDQYPNNYEWIQELGSDEQGFIYSLIECGIAFGLDIALKKAKSRNEFKLN